jgi:hypothetical protein
MIHTVQVVDEDFDRYAAEMLKSIDVIFLERWTYQLFAGYWPSTTGPDIDTRDIFMSGFDLLIRLIGGSRRSGLKKRRQVALALKSNEN